MGEAHRHGGAPGRRPAHHPAGAASGGFAHTPDEAALEAMLEAVLGAAMRGGALDARAEEEAVAAFRAARDAGTHRARTRRRDDWRPRDGRRARRSVRATLTVFLASLTLGGVAVATIGSAGSSDGGESDPRRPGPSASVGTTPGRGASSSPGTPPGGGPPASAATSAAPDRRDAAARETEAQCRAYENVADRGRALDSPAWQRLVEAAGGADRVGEYCARLSPPPGDGNSAKPDTPDPAGDPGRGPGAGEQPGGGEQPGAGEQPGGGEQPGAGEQPDVGEQPGAGDKPDGGEWPSAGTRPSAGAKPSAANGRSGGGADGSGNT
ncbi:hypothetical protein ACLGIH_12500 [Streptomyces sp. HMX87]|uniref:hypothetical protein n=1 Tax=Streptomyces sp. HMX87 TaxID=3390849 RepID=UPI003A871805